MCDGCNQVQARRGPLEGMPSSRARGSWRMLTPRPCGRCIYRVQPISAGLTCAAGALGRARAGGAQGSAAPRAARPPGPHGLAARRLVRAWPRPVRLPAPASPRATRSVLAPCCLLNWGRDRVLQALRWAAPVLSARACGRALLTQHLNKWLAARGRHSVVISEAPVLAPLVPLAAFVSGVGPPPPRAALHTYLARLREQARPAPLASYTHPPLTLLSPSSHPSLTLLLPLPLISPSARPRPRPPPPPPTARPAAA